MKRKLLVFVTVLVMLVGCSSNKKNYELMAPELLDKIENKETFVLYVGSENCGACQQFEPVFAEYAKAYPEIGYKMEINIAATKYSEALESIEGAIGKILVTPTIFIIKEGEVVDKQSRILKYVELEGFNSRFDLNK